VIRAAASIAVSLEGRGGKGGQRKGQLPTSQEDTVFGLCRKGGPWINGDCLSGPKEGKNKNEKYPKKKKFTAP